MTKSCRNRNHREQRLAKGRCLRCGSGIPDPGLVTCRRCIDYSYDQGMTSRVEAILRGDCSSCTKRPAAPDRKTCRVCLDAALARLRAKSPAKAPRPARQGQP